MTTLLQNLLAMKKQLAEDEVATASKPEAEAPANPVSAEPDAAPADAAPAADAPAPEEKEDELEEEYTGSAEFTEEFHSLFAKVEEAKKIVHSPRFNDWMKATDENFNVEVQPLIPPVIEAIDALDAALKVLEEELMKAE